MRYSRASFVLAFVFAGSAFGQIVSVGVKGGVPFQGALTDTTISSIDTAVHTFSDSKNYIVGLMVELHLPLGFSVEADGLYRPLTITSDSTVFPRPPIRTSTNVSSWEFLIVAKYRLPFPVIKPYVEAGPNFRKTGRQLSYLSNNGFVVGGGVELKLGRLRVGPEVRYMHWAADGVNRFINFPPSQQNQAELLVGFSF